MGLAELKAAQAAAAQQERTTGDSGVVPNTPKQTLFDARDVEAKHPDKRLRWVNLRNPDKVAARIAEGYVRLAEADGGRHLGGDYALFAMPRDAYNRKMRAIAQVDEMRLHMHKTEFERVVENVARELRDKHGVNITAEELMKE